MDVPTDCSPYSQDVPSGNQLSVQKSRFSNISAEQAFQIKKAFVGENEDCLLARIYSTHFWEGSKFQYMHHFFCFFLPQMIHYMTVNQEPGIEWSPMPLHMHTSIAQPPPAQDTRDLDLQSCAQPLMSEMTQSRGL